MHFAFGKNARSISAYLRVGRVEVCVAAIGACVFRCVASTAHLFYSVYLQQIVLWFELVGNTCFMNWKEVSKIEKS